MAAGLRPTSDMNCDIDDRSTGGFASYYILDPPSPSSTGCPNNNFETRINYVLRSYRHMPVESTRACGKIIGDARV